MTPGSVRNIIFDLGGVLLNIDYHKTEAAFRELGFAHFDQMYSQFRADELFEQLETGHIEPVAFYDRLNEKADPAIPTETLASAWNAMILDYRQKSLEHLKVLKAHYKLFLLSNTNEIHIEALKTLYTSQFGKGWLDDYFDKAYYSSRIGLRKPHPSVYEWVLKDAGIKAEETLFIDDSYNNIETANLVGLKTHLLLPGEKIEDLVSIQ